METRTSEQNEYQNGAVIPTWPSDSPVNVDSQVWTDAGGTQDGSSSFVSSTDQSYHQTELKLSYHQTEVKQIKSEMHHKSGEDDGCCEASLSDRPPPYHECTLECTLLKEVFGVVPEGDDDHSMLHSPIVNSNADGEGLAMTSDKQKELLDMIKQLQLEQQALQKKFFEHDKHLKSLIERQPTLKRRLTTRLMKGGRRHAQGEASASDNSATITGGKEEEKIYAQIEKLYNNFFRINITCHDNSRQKSQENNGEIYSDACTDADMLIYENQQLRRRIEYLDQRIDPGVGSGQPGEIKPDGYSNIGFAECINWSTLNSANGLMGLDKDNVVEQIKTTFEWKIYGYSVKKQLERRQRIANTVSNPFNIGNTGYRCRLEIFLNGNGSGQDKCLSIFLRIIKGKFDDQLKWPAKFSLSFVLINQDENKNDSLISNNNNTFQFSRPRDDSENGSDAWGLIEFVPHSVIQTKNYIKNDMITLQVKVEKPEK